MKRFLFQIVIFSFVAAISMLFIFLLADGTSDAMYLKFTVPQQQSLIIGNSRASEGLLPQILNDSFSKEGKHNVFYNYAFTIGHSPYGATYLQSIQKKINPSVKDGVYIVVVDPWSISANKPNPDDSTKFVELQLALGTTKYVNIYPNLFYLINAYSEPYFDIIKRSIKPSPTFLHDDGWLEVTVPMDSASIKRRMRNTITEYKVNKLPLFQYSKVRYDYLNKTIEFLKTHGKVYLVRLPIHQKIKEVESSLMPNFDSLMTAISVQQKVEYFNYIDSTNYTFIDGSHLFKSSAEKISTEIATKILSKQ